MDNQKQNNIKEIFEKAQYRSLDTFMSGGKIGLSSRLFFSYWGQIPSIFDLDSIDDKKLKGDIEKGIFGMIVHRIFREEFNVQVQMETFSSHNFFLESGMMINLTTENAMLFFPETSRVEAIRFYAAFKKYKIKRKRTTEISLITTTTSGLETQNIAIKKPKIDLHLHYNDDFSTIHKMVLKNINKPNTSGLYLFHGNPGTGKSTYIKYLIHQINKKVIFLSTKMAGELDNAAMTPLLLQNRNAVIVIEDAEELITSREEVRNSNLSMLLNLTDGLLGESLGIQIIATFNTDVKNIDKALLRKGRLSTIYEFRPLTLEKTNILLTKLGHDINVATEWTLADIFNFETINNFEPQLKKAIGFGN
ncbi:MAG: AAA family ATPase [Flavobacteriaceae bacterium]|nr:AAA family ATPase [Flavobacteriaceae bacterium]